MNGLPPNIGYLNQLKLNREKYRLEREKTVVHSLPVRIETWFNSLPEESQKRAWSMYEFKMLFPDEIPQRIGAALFALGWERRRQWKDNQPAMRYWVKLKE